MKQIYIVLLVSCKLFFFSSCTYGDSKLILPESKKMIFSGVELTSEEQKRIKVLFKEMKFIKKEIYNKAEAHLLCYVEGETEPKTYAVFLKDGLVFEGYYLDAWTERMEGKESMCYKITSDISKLFKSILLRKKK